MRSGFISREGTHVLIAVAMTLFILTPWAIVKVDDAHEIMLSVAVLVYLLTTGRLYIERYTRDSMRKVLISPAYRGWAVLKGGTEVLSVVGFGSGTFNITGAVKHWFVRLASVSLTTNKRP